VVPELVGDAVLAAIESATEMAIEEVTGTDRLRE
jgi:hypothetical protein